MNAPFFSTGAAQLRLYLTQTPARRAAILRAEEALFDLRVVEGGFHARAAGVVARHVWAAREAWRAAARHLTPDEEAGVIERVSRRAPG